MTTDRRRQQTHIWPSREASLPPAKNNVPMSNLFRYMQKKTSNVKTNRLKSYKHYTQYAQIYRVSQNFYPSEVFSEFFPNGWEFLSKILHAHWVFISMANYKIYSLISKLDKVIPKLCATIKTVSVFWYTVLLIVLRVTIERNVMYW